MYNHLLLKTGGGIVSTSQMAQQANAATINIGLGGTGIDCLKKLKKEVYARIVPDNGENSVVPKYSHIKFLAVDTDRNSLDSTKSFDTINDTQDEFFDISCGDLQSFLTGMSEKKENYPEYSWLVTRDVKNGKKGISIKSAKAGAGGVRMAGRILMLQKSSEFKTKIQSLISEATADLHDNEININIFTGVSGGTGAGTFLDVCYIIRNVISETMTGDNCPNISGFFFLPDVNYSKYSSDYLMTNGFASLKELSYCMNFDENGGEWNQLYHGFSYRTKEPPVDAAYLISATNESGDTISDGYNYAMNVAVSAAFEFITKPYIPQGAVDGADGNTFTVSSHYSNLGRHVSDVMHKSKEHGCYYNYFSLGASVYYLPYKDIMTYLASKIFAEFDKINQNTPLENDISDFITKNQLGYDDIYKALGSGVTQIPFYEVDKETLKDALPSLDANKIPLCLKRMDDAKRVAVGDYETNAAALTDDIGKVIDGESSIKSLINRINEAVKSIAKSTKGPYYAISLLHNVQQDDLRNIIMGYKKTNSEFKSRAIATRQLRYEELDTALINAKKKANEKNRKAYVAAFYAYIVQEVTVCSYEQMEALLNKLEEQVNDLYNQYYMSFEKMIREISETFNQNLAYLNEAKLNEQSTSFKQPLIDVNDSYLKESLDNTVQNMKIDTILSSFIDYMLNNDEEWLSGDENRISKIVVDFFLKELDQFANNSISYYLKLKYSLDPKATDAGTQATLQQNIYDDILTKAYLNSAVKYPMNSQIAKMSDAHKLIYCSVPYVSSDINAAASTLIHNYPSDDILKRQLENQDEISIFRYACGTPLSAYSKAEIYYNHYKADNDPGKHLYEGVDGGENWNKLPNIIPFSSFRNDNMPADLSDHAKEYDKAVESGVIEYVYGDEAKTIVNECILNIYDKSIVNDIVEKIVKVADSGNYDKIETALKNLPELNATDKRFITNDGCANHQKVVCKDTALNSLYICQLIQEQNALVERYNQAVEKLHASLESSDPEIFMQFTDALCCGVIYKESRLVYRYKNGAGFFDDDEALTTKESEPYGKYLPLYSAFVNYKALPAETKKLINDSVEKIKEDDDKYETVYKASKNEIKDFIITQGKDEIGEATRMKLSEIDEIKQAFNALASAI